MRSNKVLRTPHSALTMSTAAKLERSVQISMAIVVSLGTLLLGLGQQSVLLPCVAILASVASVVLTDITGKFRLNRNVANLAALLAVGYALSDFFDRRSSETQLLAVANLLVYLQIVLQFQEKSLRVYWSLSVLSLLQVVVAAALNLSVAFGPLLLIYLLVALTGMCMLFVLRETYRFGPHEDRDAPTPPAGPVRRRWPLAGYEVHWSGAGGEDPALPLLGGQLVRTVGAMVLLTLLVTAFVFYGTPRYQRQAWQSPTARAISIVGFSEQVSLGQMGQILQSDDPVMRVSFVEAGASRPFQVSGEPYLHGTSLTTYQRHRRRSEWTGAERNDPDRLPMPSPGQGRVTQLITIDSPVQSSMAGRYSVLFSTWPVYQHSKTPPTLLQGTIGRQLLIDNAAVPERSGQFSYIVRSGAFRGRQQGRLSPGPVPFTLDESQLLEVPDDLPALVALAESVVQDSGAATPMAKARALEGHFHVPGKYFYDLDPHVTQNPELDPLEDFVANHRTGHCEYFASALVMMLRSQGIPARMVVGYKGGEYNSVGNYYLFRQRHAHAWVEVYLSPGEFPIEQVVEREGMPLGRGAWLRLDPTPADVSIDADTGSIALLDRIADVADYVQLLWTDYVLGLNPERQRTGIYGPIGEALTTAWRSVFGGGRRGWWIVIAVFLVVFSAITALVLALASPRRVPVGVRNVTPLVGWLSAQLGRLKLDWLRQWLTPPSQAHGPRPGMHVEFYERLEAALRRYGVVRLLGQTQREYAAAAGGRLADEPRLQSVAGVPRRVVDAFYRVRFGGPALDSREQQTVEQAIADLESALATAKQDSVPSV